MADPLSVAGSAVGIVSLGLSVTKGLVAFYSSVRDRKSSTANTARKLECLLDSLNVINSQISDPNFRPKRDLLGNIETSIQSCNDSIGKLEAENKKFQDLPMDSISTAARAGLRRVAYPFKEETLKKLEDDVDAAISCLHLALQALQKYDRDETKSLLDLVRADQISSDIRDWLKAPDASIEYNAGCKKKREHPSTGLWFVKGKPFSSWLESSNSFLWLNGFAGSGKSVLCSTAIQSAFIHRGDNKCIGIAFFFFVFNDKSKQDASAMLRSLILQLSTQLEDRSSLLELHNRYRNTAPPDDALAEYLHQLISMFDRVYVLLDALDESPRDKSGKRKDVLNILVEMQNWAEPGLHLMVTSRDEPDIREKLSAPKDKIISMWNESVDHDIATFVSKHLRESGEFQAWEDDYDKIETVFTSRAKGVFRWVECQFKALENCPQSDDELDELLDSLPDSLDETYERILLNINPKSMKYARPILTLLCYAQRPLTWLELRDAIAVDLGNPAQFKPGRRLKTADAIHRVCPEFIELDEQPDGKPPTVRIAHFSVQEYLESGRLSSEIAKFSVQTQDAHTQIASICLTYLLEPELHKSTNPKEEYPLAPYAAKTWHEHLLDGYKTDDFAECQIMRLFRNTEAFKSWVTVWNIDRYNVNKPSGEIPSPIYYSSLIGLDSVLTKLLHSRVGNISDVNAQGGYYGNALQAASFRGHEAIVRLLLEKGADVNAQGGHYGNALQAASWAGPEAIMQLLLEKGADVNAQGGHYGNALQAASCRGHEAIVRLLLEKCANVNAQGGHYGNTLQAASFRGHEAIVRLLLEKGANVNAQGGYYGNTLQAASFRGHEAIVRLLLEKGANINAQGGHYGNALQAASCEGHEAIMRLLLEKGANINAQGGHFSNALQAASFRGHEAIMRLLLEKGADVNAQGGHYGNALQAASFRGHEAIVRLLLEKGADVNAQGGSFGNALQAASCVGHEAIVRLLLEKGADVNAQGGSFGNALQAASCEGHEAIMRLLLEKGADVNAQGGHYGNALQAASCRGHEATMQLLLEKGADVNAQGGHYGNALQAASSEGHEAIVQLLLEKGADVNAQGGSFGNALQAASCVGHEAIVRLLLEKGADVNAQGGYFGNALQAASFRGHEAIVRLLLEKGAETKGRKL